MTTRIAIIVFNISNLLELQVELWRKYLDCEIVVIDNSTDLYNSREVKAICERLGVEFVKTGIYEGDSSRSHGFACNVAYSLFGDCDILGLVDHDIFPFKPVDMSFMENNYMAGIAQQRNQFIYLWPGLIFIDPQVGPIDFLPAKKKGTHLDTGAGTWDYVNNGSAIEYFDEIEVKGDRTYYQIHDCFMHFQNASNWKDQEGNEDRINDLITILKDKCD